MKQPQEIYILKADTDGTMRSFDEPLGVAVTTEEEAKRFVEESNVGYSRSYQKIVLFDNKDDALKYLYPEFYGEASQ